MGNHSPEVRNMMMACFANFLLCVRAEVGTDNQIVGDRSFDKETEVVIASVGSLQNTDDILERISWLIRTFFNFKCTDVAKRLWVF